MPPSSQLAAVFFDLDETLIRSCPSDALISYPEPPSTIYGPWSVWLRPSARSLLAIARAMRVPVLLCTMAEHRYALGITQALNLGFQSNEILAIEQLRMGKFNLCPRGVLMDDLPVQHDAVVIKHRILGLSPDRHFQVPTFRGGLLESDEELTRQWSLFLRRVAQGAATSPEQ